MSDRWFFVHIMKTAGTTLRIQMQRSLPDELYPTLEELRKNPSGFYLAPAALERIYSQGPAIGTRRVIFGHYSHAFLRQLDPGRKIASFFREPVARLLSMANQFSRFVPPFEGLAIADVLRNPFFSRFADYQTKIFSMPSAGADVNIAMADLAPDLDAALANVDTLDYVGVSEQYAAAATGFARAAGVSIDLGDEHNRAPSYAPTAEERALATEMNALDRVLYDHVVARVSGG
jgi:hypothetical protein